MGSVTLVFALASLSVGTFSIRVPKWHRNFERRFNDLEKKVLTESVEFRDEILSLHQQIGENGTTCACGSSDINAIEDASIVNNEVVRSPIVETLIDGFRAEKEHVRHSLTEFSDTLDKYSNEFDDLHEVDDALKDEIAIIVEKRVEEEKHALTRNMLQMSTKFDRALNDKLETLKMRSEAEATSCEQKMQAMRTTFEREIEAVKQELREIRQEVSQKPKACGGHYQYSYGNSCYGIPKSQQTWRDARVICRAIGGYLAEVDDANEDLFLYNLAKQLSGRNGYYLGATDATKEGTWVWEYSGRKLDDVYKNWGGNEPNGGRGENCLSLHRNANYMWIDYDCSIKNWFICEK